MSQSPGSAGCSNSANHQQRTAAPIPASIGLAHGSQDLLMSVLLPAPIIDQRVAGDELAAQGIAVHVVLPLLGFIDLAEEVAIEFQRLGRHVRRADDAA